MRGNIWIFWESIQETQEWVTGFTEEGYTENRGKEIKKKRF